MLDIHNGLNGRARSRPLFNRRQLAQVIEAEILKEIPGGGIKNRPPRPVLSSFFLNQTPFQKGVYGTVHAYPAQRLDLRPGHRLLVGDNRQRLQGGLGKRGLPRDFLQFFYIISICRSEERRVGKEWRVRSVR